MSPLTSSAPRLAFEDTVLDGHLSLISEDKPLAYFDFEPLNRLLGGIYPCQMTAIGASPGSGKTTLLCQLADGVAAQGYPVLFITEELPAYKLIAKSLVRLSNGALTLEGISNEARLDPLASHALEIAIERYRATIAPNICYETVSSAADIGRLIGECRNLRGVTPVVFVDYLQLLATKSATPFSDERLSITQCVTELRGICNAYEAPIYVLSSVSREFYGNRTPSLKMFGGASVIEYTFDNALYIHEDRDGCSLNGGKPLLISAIKSRYRALGTASMAFYGAFAAFSDGQS